MRCGIFFSWQLGHSDAECAVRKSWARRVDVLFCECRRFGFGMVVPFPIGAGHRRPGATISFQLLSREYLSLELLANIFQGRPAWIRHYGHAIATFLIQVFTALRAKPFAVCLAELLCR